MRFVCRNVDQVHDMMDDIAEQQDLAKEIGEAISNPVAFGMFYEWLYCVCVELNVNFMISAVLRPRRG